MLVHWLKKWKNRLRTRVTHGVRETKFGESKRIEQGPSLLVFESELRAIGGDSILWPSETGGDLFGVWSEPPVVYLATNAGPSALREAAHFRLDIDYVRKVSSELSRDWGLTYFGDWHSHHKLGLNKPSTGDQVRITRLANKNNFASMAEIIVTIRSGDQPNVDIHSFLYELPSGTPKPLNVAVVRGVSPVREALFERGYRVYQNWQSWLQFPLDRIRINGGRSAPHFQDATWNDGFVSGALLRQLRRAFEDKDYGVIEDYDTDLGHIFAVPAGNDCLVGIAVDRKWPCRVLEVDWIDRSQRTAVPVLLSPGVDLLVPDRVIDLYEKVLDKQVRRLKENSNDS